MARLLPWAPRVLALLLLAVGVTALVAPRNTWFVFPPLVVWVSTVAALLLLWLGREPARAAAAWVARRPTASVALGTAGGGALAAVHLPLARVDLAWDPRVVFEAAERWVDGAPQSEEALNYFAMYPNNLLLFAYEGTVMRGGSALGLSFLGAVLVAQLLCFLVILWCLGSALVRLSRPGAVWPVQALATVLLGLNANLSIPYSDVPAAAAVAVAVWAAVRAWTGAGRHWWAVALGALVVAMSLKAYTVALALGALAMLPRLVRRSGALVAAGSVLLGVVALGAGVLGTQEVAARAVGMPAETRDLVRPAYPPLHFLAMGTYDNADPSPARTYGGFSTNHNHATGAEREPEARDQMLRAMVRQQIAERGVRGNVSFFAKKVAWTWGDGTFWAHGEGPDKEADGALGPARSDVQRWFIGSGEPYQRWRAPVTQGIWVATLLVTAVGAWRARDRTWVQVCALTLLALTAYLTLFESRPRYLIAMLPVLLLLTGLTARQGGPGWSGPGRGWRRAGRRQAAVEHRPEPA